MKNYFIPLVVSGLLLAGCSSAYKTGQTPDDVYYSTSPVMAAEVTKNKQVDDGYESYWQNSDDAYLRMKVRNGGRWNSLDDQDYWYGYSAGCQCNSNWGYYNSFNSFNRPWGWNTLSYSYGYNPWGSHNWYNSGYYYPVVVVTKYPPMYTNPSRPSLRGYGNSVYGGSNYGIGKKATSPNAGSGSMFRTIFSGTNNSGNTNSSYDRPSRTFNSSSNSSSGSSSGGSSSGGSSRSSGTSSGGRGGRGN